MKQTKKLSTALLEKLAAAAAALLLLASTLLSVHQVVSFQKAGGTIVCSSLQIQVDLSKQEYTTLVQCLPAQRSFTDQYHSFAVNYAQFNPNSPQNLLYTDGKRIINEQTLLYPPDGTEKVPGILTSPRAIPDSGDLSFVVDNQLYIFPQGSAQAEPAANLSPEDGYFTASDWLDSKTLLFMRYKEGHPADSIASYDRTTGRISTYIENACNPSLSLNRRYLAYTSNGRTILRDLSTGRERSRKIPDIGRLATMVPSNDGTYLAFLSQPAQDKSVLFPEESTAGRLIICNMQTGRRRVVSGGVMPQVLSWSSEEALT